MTDTNIEAILEAIEAGASRATVEKLVSEALCERTNMLIGEVRQSVVEGINRDINEDDEDGEDEDGEGEDEDKKDDK